MARRLGRGGRVLCVLLVIAILVDLYHQRRGCRNFCRRILPRHRNTPPCTLQRGNRPGSGSGAVGSSVSRFGSPWASRSYSNRSKSEVSFYPTVFRSSWTHSEGAGRGQGYFRQGVKVGHPAGTACPSGQTERIKVIIMLRRTLRGGRGSVGRVRSAIMHQEVVHYMCPRHRKRYTRSSLIMLSNGKGGRGCGVAQTC